MRPADFFVDFFGAAFIAPLFRLITVFFAISRPVARARTLEVPGSQVEPGERRLKLNMQCGVYASRRPALRIAPFCL
jgi:hypothetical protein